MRLLDRIICVHCNRVAYKASAGKGSRSFMGECEPSCEEAKHGVPAKDEPSGKSKVVPAR